MSKVNLNKILNVQDLTTLNENFDILSEELNDKVLYRDNPVGEPNEMSNDIDMNSNTVYNLRDAIDDHEAVPLHQLLELLGQVESAKVNESFVLTAGQTVVDVTSVTVNANFYITGINADNGRLLKGIDYTTDEGTSTIILENSYPAGTILYGDVDIDDGMDFTPEVPEEDLFLFTTVGALRNSTLEVGKFAVTLGYYAVGDGGGATYRIEDSSTTTDNMGRLYIGNGNVAVIQFASPLDVRKLGASMLLADNAPIIQAAYTYSSDIEIVGGVGQSEIAGEMYNILSQIDVPSLTSTTIGQGTTIKAIGCSGFVSSEGNEFVTIHGGKILGDFNTVAVGIHIIGNPRSSKVSGSYIRGFAGTGSVGVKIEHGSNFTFRCTLEDVVAESNHINYEITGNSIVLDNCFGRFSQGDAISMDNCAGVTVNGGGYENPTAAIDGQVGMRLNNIRVMTMNATYLENCSMHNLLIVDSYAITLNSVLSANITTAGTQVKLTNCEGVRGNLLVQNIDPNEVGIEIDSDCINCDLNDSTFRLVSGVGTFRLKDLSSTVGIDIPISNGGAIPSGTEQIRYPSYNVYSDSAIATSSELAILDAKDGALVTFLNVGDHTIVVRNNANTKFAAGIDYQFTAGSTLTMIYSSTLGYWTEVT